MSAKPSAFGMLSALENEKCDNLSACLSKLGGERNRLQADFEAAQTRRREMDAERQLNAGKSVKASELSIWEQADRELKIRMDAISLRLAELRNEEKTLRSSLSVHMGKHHAWETMLGEEIKKKQRLSVQSDQRAVDDLIAHRPRRPV